MVLMAAACLPCALMMWNGAGAKGARMLMYAGPAMAALHGGLLYFSGGAANGSPHTAR